MERNQYHSNSWVVNTISFKVEERKKWKPVQGERIHKGANKGEKQEERNQEGCSGRTGNFAFMEWRRVGGNLERFQYC